MQGDAEIAAKQGLGGCGTEADDYVGLGQPALQGLDKGGCRRENLIRRRKSETLLKGTVVPNIDAGHGPGTPSGIDTPCPY